MYEDLIHLDNISCSINCDKLMNLTGLQVSAAQQKDNTIIVYIHDATKPLKERRVYPFDNWAKAAFGLRSMYVAVQNLMKARG